LTGGDAAVIRAWLARIEETDPAIIATVLCQCSTDADALDYYSQRARMIPGRDVNAGQD